MALESLGVRGTAFVWAFARALPAAGGAIVISTAIMAAFRLPSSTLPLILAATGALLFYLFRRLRIVGDASSLTGWEWAFLLYSALIGVVRLLPFIHQHAFGQLSAAAIWDDNWHFQELASLINSETFPPVLNYEPTSYFHYYYLPWIPAAALSDLLRAVTGHIFLKLTFGLDALLLDFSVGVLVILFLRHLLAPAQRPLALLAVLLAGAVPDGLYSIWKIAKGILSHSEWWQPLVGGINQYSAWTTLLIWVPQHMISAGAILLGLVILTEPSTLAPRRSLLSSIAAGVVASFALYSSIFVCVGAFIALVPLLWRWRVPPVLVVAFVATTAIVSLPLAYIYLGANAATALYGEAFDLWHGRFGSLAMGVVGVAANIVFMLAEIGWLVLHAAIMARKHPADRSVLATLAASSFVFLLITVFLSYPEANQFAFRGSIVPTVLICCYWAQQLERTRAADLGRQNGWHRYASTAIGIGVVALGGAAHLNELANWSRDSVTATTYALETRECKELVMKVNTSSGYLADVSPLSQCRDKYIWYNIERLFTKPTLSAADRQLRGRQP